MLRRTGEALFKAARWRRQHTLGCMAWRAWRERAARCEGLVGVFCDAGVEAGCKCTANCTASCCPRALTCLACPLVAQAELHQGNFGYRE